MNIVEAGVEIADCYNSSGHFLWNRRDDSQTITEFRSRVVWPSSRAHSEQVSVELGSQPWFTSVWARLNKFKKLPLNWNGYGEMPIEDRAIQKTLQLLESVAVDAAAPEVMPMPDGGVQVEWDRGGCELEVEVPASGPLIVLFVDADGSEQEYALEWAQVGALRFHLAAMERSST